MKRSWSFEVASDDDDYSPSQHSDDFSDNPESKLKENRRRTRWSKSMAVSATASLVGPGGFLDSQTTDTQFFDFEESQDPSKVSPLWSPVGGDDKGGMKREIDYTDLQYNNNSVGTNLVPPTDDAGAPPQEMVGGVKCEHVEKPAGCEALDKWSDNDRTPVKARPGASHIESHADDNSLAQQYKNGVYRPLREILVELAQARTRVRALEKEMVQAALRIHEIVVSTPEMK